MQARPNIMKRSNGGMLRGVGMVIAGFVAMVAGLCLGSYIAERRQDAAIVRGTRLQVVLQVARMGPRPVRQAAMAAMADGVLTVREERHLYMVIDQARRNEARARRAREQVDDGRDRHTSNQMI